MARQQRLPFDWSSGAENPDGAERIRPVMGEAPLPPEPDDLELQAESRPEDAETQKAAPRGPARPVRIRLRANAPRPETDSEDDYDDDVPVNMGQLLVEGRSAAGLSIAQVSERTKVPPQFIEAAENELFSEFPASLYARSHLLKLCAAYKIPGQQILALYQAAMENLKPAEPPGKNSVPHPAVSGNVDLSQYAPRIQTQKSSSGGGQRLTVTVVSVALILIVGVVLTAFVLTHIRNVRLNRQTNGLDVDPNASADLQVEELINPTPLPLKEIPLP